MLDGGNTEATLNSIEDAEYAEAFELYNELMSMSPALSREVMIEAIQKETELPVVLLTAILAAKPSAAKDPVIQDELDKRTNLLTNYQRELINQGLYVLSSKENMESAMANVMSDFCHLLAYEYQRIASDETVADKASAWEGLMSIASDPYGLWMRTNWLAAQNRYAEAHSLGTQALGGLRPMSDCKPDWTNYLSLLQTLAGYATNPEFALNEAQQQSLLNMIDESQPSTKGLIFQTINQYGNAEIEFATSYPIDENGLRSMSFSVDETTPAWLSIYPNPVGEYFSIRLADAPTSTKASYVVTDILGRKVITGSFSSNNQEVIIDSSKLQGGTYVLSIFDGEHLLLVEKLSKF